MTADDLLQGFHDNQLCKIEPERIPPAPADKHRQIPSEIYPILELELNLSSLQLIQFCRLLRPPEVCSTRGCYRS